MDTTTILVLQAVLSLWAAIMGIYQVKFRVAYAWVSGFGAGIYVATLVEMVMSKIAP